MYGTFQRLKGTADVLLNKVFFVKFPAGSQVNDSNWRMPSQSKQINLYLVKRQTFPLTSEYFIVNCFYCRI